ncbi:MAG: aminotransferase class V-fold PLP-dependent enzyme [Negativicutes bacterium]|nr:aminotransferase class V-fold PLP-dependent enzyme [Negativicutes bacterium]
MIYLDNAATSWPKPEAVYQAVTDSLRHSGGSPGRSEHRLARAAEEILFQAREEIAGLLAVTTPASIIFTYNATDALNISLFGLLNPGDRVVTTTMEHNAVVRPLKELEKRGVRLDVIECDPAGRLPLDKMKNVLTGARAVVVGHGSNVAGTLAPLAEIGKLAVDAGAVFIVDAAQTCGVEEIDIGAMRIDILAFSGHKGLLGTQGTGGLYVREDLKLEPLRYGGTGSLSEADGAPDFYPERLECGTPNTPGIAGLLAGVRFIRATGLERIRQAENTLVTELMAGLAEIPKVIVYGPAATERRTAVVSFTVDGVDSGEVAWRLDREFDIACRAGLHCAPWAHRTIGTLKTGTVRFSPGYFNTAGEIGEAVRAVRAIAAGGGKA